MDQSRLKDSFLTDNSHRSLILVHFQSRTQRAVIIFYYLFFEDSGACEDSGTAQSERWIRKTWETRAQPFPDTPRAFNYPWRKQSKDLLAVYQSLELNLFEFLLQSTWLQILALLWSSVCMCSDSGHFFLYLLHFWPEWFSDADGTRPRSLFGSLKWLTYSNATHQSHGKFRAYADSCDIVWIRSKYANFMFLVNSHLTATKTIPFKSKIQKMIHISFTVCRLS